LQRASNAPAAAGAILHDAAEFRQAGIRHDHANDIGSLRIGTR
jgi:hypothetical protein